MSVFRLPLLLGVIGFASFASTAGIVFTSGNVVAKSSADVFVQAQGVNDFKPSGCTQTLDTLVVSSGGVTNDSNDSDLILGSPGDDTVHAQNGNDCILGGGGNDLLEGKSGADVIYGGPGTDVCDGGAGVDTFPGGDCETVIP